ncbi:ABC transporter ATP-binding protein [Candidatus Omnitrophota bacterium]
MKRKNTEWTRFNKYLYKYWKLEAAAIVLGLVAMPLGLINPYLAKLVIDQAYANKDLKLFLILAAIGGIAFVVNNLVQLLNSYLSQRISRNVNFDMSKDLFRHLQSLPLSFFNSESTGRHIYRINSDIGLVSGFICNVIPQIITLVPRLVFILVIVLYLNWRLALLAVILAPATYIRAHFFGRWLKEMMWRLREKSQDIFTKLYEVFSHMHLVKAFGRENYEIKGFEQKLLKKLDFERNNARISHASNFFSSILNRAITGLIALYGGYLLITGKTTLGSLTAVMMYTTQLIGLIGSIGGIVETASINSVSRQHLAEILDLKPKIHDKKGAIAYKILQGKIEFKGVDFGYTEDKFILSGLGLSMPGGAKIALVGHSGCGKSTLLSLLLRIYEPEAGAILIDGLDIRAMKLEFLKAQIGIALQEPFLLNDSFKGNILYAQENASTAEVMEAARLAEADSFILSFPDKYDTQIGENACKISEGQKQRVAIARAIIKKPKLIIIDEGMSSLDSKTEERIIDNLKKEFSESTLIVVSHRLSTVRQMDLVYFLNTPSCIEVGTHLELTARSAQYQELFAGQNKKANVLAKHE